VSYSSANDTHCAVAWFIRFFRCSFVVAAAAAATAAAASAAVGVAGLQFSNVAWHVGNGHGWVFSGRGKRKRKTGRKLLCVCVVGWFYGASSNVWLALAASRSLARSPSLSPSLSRLFASLHSISMRNVFFSFSFLFFYSSANNSRAFQRARERVKMEERASGESSEREMLN